MDTLSQVITLLKPRAVWSRVIEAHDAWAVRFQPEGGIVVFGQMLEGSCRVERRDRAAFVIEAGDFLLMASPPAWSMRAPNGRNAIDFPALLEKPRSLMSRSRPQSKARFIAGNFTFASEGAGLAAKLMLPVIHIRSSAVRSSHLGGLLAIVGEEALADKPGRSLVLERLLEVILVEALRHHQTEVGEARPGLLHGLADPQLARALSAMHEDTDRSWTLESLARHAGMSRSAFADRFATAVGSSPIAYLATWRMALAKTALVEGKLPMARIAERAGYQSVSAFSTAFRKLHGMPPSAYASTLEPL